MSTPETNPWPISKVTPWVNGAPVEKVPTLDEVLMQWQTSKQALETVKEEEMRLRKLAFAMGFGVSAQEGTNTLELGNGFELKGVKKLNYKLVAPENYNGSVLDAVDACIDKFINISNEGSFIAERLFKWSVELSKTEYNKLVEEATNEPTKQKLLAEANKVIEINEAAPALEIKPPKVKK